MTSGFEEEEDPTTRSFFSEIISSISDVKFSHDGRYILHRDYLSLKIWDINMETKPIKTIPIHDHLKGKLCDLYENDCIFDKFECVWGGDDKYVFSFSADSSTSSFVRIGPQSLERPHVYNSTSSLIICGRLVLIGVSQPHFFFFSTGTCSRGPITIISEYTTWILSMMLYYKPTNLRSRLKRLVAHYLEIKI